MRDDEQQNGDTCTYRLREMGGDNKERKREKTRQVNPRCVFKCNKCMNRNEIEKVGSEEVNVSHRIFVLIETNAEIL